MTCPDQDTMHEAALGRRLVFSSEVGFQIGSVRELCSVGQNVRNAGTALGVATTVVYSPIAAQW
jgi:hypothetical protein